MDLFGEQCAARAYTTPREAQRYAAQLPGMMLPDVPFSPGVDESVVEVFRAAENPADPFELRDLWLARTEHALGEAAHRPWLAECWRAARMRRTISADEVLNSRTTVRFVKEMFNFFFRDDLFGELPCTEPVVLCTGAVDEASWGLPETLKDCVRFALENDLYGYSDSRGRISAREAVAAYENGRISGAPYGPGNIALTLGATFGISAIADFVLSGTAASAPVLCGIPNYPPLVESIGRRHDVALVPLPSGAGCTSLEPLIERLSHDTPMVMVQTAANPTGALVPEADIERLIAAASPNTIIVLDECHEWLGTFAPCSAARSAPNVVRMSSLSKTWSTPGLKVGWFMADQAFIDEYYEYASTSFGGPPSFFYTLVEVLARMERWIEQGLRDVGSAELGEFEPFYNLDRARLQAAYDSYRVARSGRDEQLRTARDATVARFSEIGAEVVPPRYSINIAMRADGWDEDSYFTFRKLYHETDVAVFPNLLTFGLSGGGFRITSACPWNEIARGTDRLRDAFAVEVAKP